MSYSVKNKSIFLHLIACGILGLQLARAGTLTITTTPAIVEIEGKKYVFIKTDENVNFQASASDYGGTIDAWKWAFENGTPTTSTEQNPGNVKFGAAAQGKSNKCTAGVTHTDENATKCTDATTPASTVYVVLPQLEFKTSTMTTWKVVDPLNPPISVRIGVINNDEVEFQAKIPSGVTLQAADFSWEGEKKGTGQTIKIKFTGTGNKTVKLKVKGVETNSAAVTVANPTGSGETAWAVLHPLRAITAGNIRDEALAWSGGHNNIGDARRHAYWNAVMTVDWNAADAEGLATAHEVTGLGNGSAHNETVMDLENNATGRGLGTAGATRAALQTSVTAAGSAGGLVILDDTTNSNEVGLLKPSNK